MTDLSTIHPTPTSRHRFHLLDALRGLAAIAVVDVHTASLIGNTVVARNGHLAVDFFFCLSGFVIAFSYERRLFEGMRMRSFLASRLIRLYPMVFIAMTIGILKPILEQLHHSDLPMLKEKFVSYLHGISLLPDLAQGYVHQVYPLDNAAWSLFFELLANALFAMLAFHRKISALLLLIAVAASAALLFVGVHADIDVSLMGSDSVLAPFLLGLPRVLLSFATGVLVLRLYRATTPWQLSPTLHPALGLGVSSALLFVLISPFSTMQTPTFQLVAITILTPCLVFLGAMTRLPERLSPLCALLGEVSYPLYLLHIVLNYAFANAGVLLVARIPALRATLLPIILILDVLIAFAVWKWIDIPLRRAAKRYYNASLAAAPAHA